MCPLFDILFGLEARSKTTNQSGGSKRRARRAQQRLAAAAGNYVLVAIRVFHPPGPLNSFLLNSFFFFFTLGSLWDEAIRGFFPLFPTLYRHFRPDVCYDIIPFLCTYPANVQVAYNVKSCLFFSYFFSFFYNCVIAKKKKFGYGSVRRRTVMSEPLYNRYQMTAVACEHCSNSHVVGCIIVQL